MDLLTWLQNYSEYIMPVVLAILAWFVNKRKNVSENENLDADTEKKQQESKQIAVQAANQTVTLWIDLYKEVQSQRESIRVENEHLISKNLKLEKEKKIYKDIAVFLLDKIKEPEVYQQYLLMLNELDEVPEENKDAS